MKRILAFVLFILMQSASAYAAGCPAVPYNLANGTNADATQVMANFDTLVNCTNSGFLSLNGGIITQGGVIIQGTNTQSSYPFTVNNAYVGVQASSPLANGIGVKGTATNASGAGVHAINTGGGFGLYCAGNGCGGTQPWTTISDGRLKTDVHNLSEKDGIAAIMKLRPVRFHWKYDAYFNKKSEQIGFVAQEVEDIFPELVNSSTQNPFNDQSNLSQKSEAAEIKDVKALSYAELVVPLVKAVQQLKTDNDALRAEFQAYKTTHP